MPFGGVDVFIHILLAPASWSAPRPDRFTPPPPGESAPGTHWVGPRAGVDAVEKRNILPLPPLVLRTPTFGYPARSQSLPRLLTPE
jgi:hypothetical protein